jgi:hypothetical protein
VLFLDVFFFSSLSPVHLKIVGFATLRSIALRSLISQQNSLTMALHFFILWIKVMIVAVALWIHSMITKVKTFTGNSNDLILDHCDALEIHKSYRKSGLATVQTELDRFYVNLHMATCTSNSRWIVLVKNSVRNFRLIIHLQHHFYWRKFSMHILFFTFSYKLNVLLLESE